MAIVTLTNSTSPNTVERATDDQDPYERETQLDSLAHNFDDHDHTAGKNLGVGRVQTASAPAAAGGVRVNGDTWQWWGATAGAVRTAVDLEGAQTIAGQKVFSANVGVGVTPGVWGGGYVALQVNGGAAMWGHTTTADVHLSSNTRYDGTNRLALTGTQAGMELTMHPTTGFQVSTAPAVAAGAVQTFTEVMRVGGVGHDLILNGTNPNLLIGTGTANGFQTVGLTINQLTNDDEILTLKSSDVAHGMTGITETDTYATFGKAVGAEGGLNVRGLNDAGVRGISLDGIATTDDTTKSAAAVAPLILQASKKSGTVTTAPGANANLVAFYVAAVGARFILDVDGDSHQDVGTAWTNFDAYDDTALLNSLAHEVARPSDPIKDEFRDWLTYNRAALEGAGLVTFNADGHHFANMSRLTMLLVGAVRQQGEQLRQLAARVAPLLEAR